VPIGRQDLPDGSQDLDIQGIFAAGGLISRSLAGFESRPQQGQMALAVNQTLANGGHLVIEAGTGVGKSFAYLIPGIQAVRRKADKVLISTFTITLQEQLINKDIPFLTDCMPNTFTAALAKGRGNYLCKRRLKFALRKHAGLLDEFGWQLAKINDWANQTEDGSLADMTFVPKNAVWDAVKSEHGNCRGRKCPHFRHCFYWRARRRLENADIIVANHALMFSDLVLKEQGVSLLPDYKYIVIDEAHNIEHVAQEHFGIDISNHRIKFLLDGLYNPRTRKGLLAYRDAERAVEKVSAITKQAKVFFKRVRDWYEATKHETAGRCYINFVDDNVSGCLKDLRRELAELAKRTEDVDEKFEIIRFADRCEALTQDLDCFLTQKHNNHVYWVEADEDTKGTVRLKSAPLNVGGDVKRCLFDKYESVILTSATLSSGPYTAANGKSPAPASPDARRGGGPIANGDTRQAISDKRFATGERGFDFFAGRVGLDDFSAVQLGSPFDYAKQVTIYIEKDLPNPNESAFIAAAAGTLKKYILQTKGRAFVLFTSYEMLETMAGEMTDWLKENDIELLQQGAGLDRTMLLKRFKSQMSFLRKQESIASAVKPAVLFGTDSFWQGVDVPGEALSNVIIARLPFEVPDKPLLAGRLEQIREQGGNPFYDYQLPFAIIKFKQGFGRLIRSKTDTGIVVILDSRIVNKPYGSRFLAAIPKCTTKIVARDS
jgi:ATP-dependent DNA helicase DinG